MANEMKTLERVATTLRQRIGEITSNYETELASLRANATIEIERLSAEVDDLRKALDEVNAKLAEAEASNASDAFDSLDS